MPKKINYILVLTGIILFPSLLSAQIKSIENPTVSKSEWKFLGLEKEMITAIAVDWSNPEIIYAGSWSNFKSLANTLKWECIGPPGGRIYSLSINSKEPHIIYGESDGGIFKSTDGGTSSELLEGYHTSPVISPLDPNFMIAGLYRTTDGGTSWNKMTTAGWSYAFHPADENIIYAINGYINNEFPGKNIIVSYDKGLNWDTLKTFTKPITQLKSTTVDQKLLFLFSDSKLLKSMDGGNSWDAILTALDGDVFGHFVVANNDSMIYVITSLLSRLGNPIKFYRSTNLGKNWVVDSTNQISPNVMIVDPINSNIIYLATGDYLTSSPGDIWKSTDGGNSWVRKNIGLPSPYNRYLYSLVINPLNPQNLYVGTYGWGVYKTTNGGESWEWTNLTKGPVFSIYIDDNNPCIIYASTIDEGVLKTTNGGLEWQPLNLNVSQTVKHPFFKIIFDPNNDNFAYIASQYGVFKSTDGGNNWNITSLLGDFDHAVCEVTVHPNNSDTVYAGMIGWLGRKDLYRSTDGADNWTNLNLTNGEEGVVRILFNPINPDIIYAAALSKGIYKSNDRGVTWLPINSGLQLTDTPLIKEINSLEIVKSDPNILYSDNGGVIKTINGGEKWVRIDSLLYELGKNIKVSRVAFINSKVYASSNNFVQGDYLYYTEGGLYVTSNDGLSWQKIGRFQIGIAGPGEIKNNPQNLNEIFITTMAGIYKSVDTVTSVERNKDIFESIHLYQNYPNPFNPSTKISFQLERGGFITIKIYNILGKEVKTLLKDNFSPGYYEIIWDGTNYSGENLPSGIYICTLKTEDYLEAKKMIILR